MSKLTSFKVFNINWDTKDDGSTSESKDFSLPEVYILSVSLEEDDDIGYILASALSDEFGFCVNDFYFEEISNED